jgi:membrane associated rhomboid family serine protease
MKKLLFKLFLKNLIKNLSITNWLIIFNIFAFLAFSILSIFVPQETIIRYIAIQPSYILHGKYLWTFITSMFMHANITHIFVNMISLFFIGNFAEKLIGRKRFLVFYMLAGISAGILFVLFGLFGINYDTFAVGASGAIFGIAGILALLTPRLPVLVFFVIPMPMWLAVVFLLSALWLVSWLAGIPIGNIAHLGGLLAGLAYGLYLRIRYKKKVKLIEKYFK